MNDLRHVRCVISSAIIAASVAATVVTPASADEVKPYDQKLMRLSEILGAVHYLRELCGANEGQAWRDKMQTLLKSEGNSAARRAKFAKSFNQGYQSYSRTYQSCTPTAKTAAGKFLAEGAEIAETLAKSMP